MAEMTERAPAVVGSSLPRFEKTFHEVDLMAYGAATWDWARVHYDVGYAKKLSFPNVFVDGQNWGAVFAKQIMDWTGPRGFVMKMALRFRSMAFAGDTIAGEAEVTDVRPAGEHTVLTISQRLTRDATVIATCVTEVRVPA